MCLSHPTGVRGLKSVGEFAVREYGEVAPHWGAWIEIGIGLAMARPPSVAPHWGAWIEIVGVGCLPPWTNGRTPLGCVD